MTTIQLRKMLKQRIDSLPVRQLRLAKDLLAYVQDQDINAATRELMDIPGLVDRIQKLRGTPASKATPWRKVRSDV
jgi:hypothetical protein